MKNLGTEKNQIKNILKISRYLFRIKFQCHELRILSMLENVRECKRNVSDS